MTDSVHSMKFPHSDIVLRGRIETVHSGEGLQEGGGIGGTGIAASGGDRPGRGPRRHFRVVNGGASTGTLTLVGFSGVAVQVNRRTRFKGVGVPTELSDLNPGDCVKVLGCQYMNNYVIAAEVERTAATAQAALQGPVDSATEPVVVILGMVVDTTAIQENKFKGMDGTSAGRQAFFHALARGMIVELEGTLAGGIVAWTEAEVRSKVMKPLGWEWQARESNDRHHDRAALMRVIEYEMVNEFGARKNRSDRGKALSVNISRGGMLVLMDRRPAIDQPMKVLMPTPSKPVNIPTLVDVRWSRRLPLPTGKTRDVYFVGLRFVL